VLDDCVEVAVSSETSFSTHKPAQWLSPWHCTFITTRIYAFASKSCKNVPARFVLSVCSPAVVDVTTVEMLNDLNQNFILTRFVSCVCKTAKIDR
jgi:hypothetical protein